VHLLQHHIYKCGQYRRYSQGVGLLPLELPCQPTSAHKRRLGEPKANLRCEGLPQPKMWPSDENQRWRPLRYYYYYPWKPHISKCLHRCEPNRLVPVCYSFQLVQIRSTQLVHSHGRLQQSASWLTGRPEHSTVCGGRTSPVVSSRPRQAIQHLLTDLVKHEKCNPLSLDYR